MGEHHVDGHDFQSVDAYQRHVESIRKSFGLAQADAQAGVAARSDGYGDGVQSHFVAPQMVEAPFYESAEHCGVVAPLEFLEVLEHGAFGRQCYRAYLGRCLYIQYCWHVWKFFLCKVSVFRPIFVNFAIKKKGKFCSGAVPPGSAARKPIKTKDIQHYAIIDDRIR